MPCVGGQLHLAWHRSVAAWLQSAGMMSWISTLRCTAELLHKFLMLWKSCSPPTFTVIVTRSLLNLCMGMPLHLPGYMAIDFMAGVRYDFGKR